MNIRELNQAHPLTSYSHGAGCGCKIAPQVLDKILGDKSTAPDLSQLLVGNAQRDDAAVFDWGDGTAIVSTTDFFMPIVDDAQDFGRIASVNAISDVYAMGGQPLLAIAILGWPINTLPVELANGVLVGARQACQEAGIPLAGGHSIDCPEPIFGLAVTGRVAIRHLKRNGGASEGAALYLTKGLGVGILSTAQKKKKLRPEDAHLARNSMLELNDLGYRLGSLDYVESMTDVTGFGLLGHLVEMCRASGRGAEVYADRVPLLNAAVLDHYLAEGCVPGGTQRNWDSYDQHIGPISERNRQLLCDPQTSGGLLVAVRAGKEADFEVFCQSQGKDLKPIGRIQATTEALIQIQ